LIDGIDTFDLSTSLTRAAASVAIRKFARDAKYSATDKDELLTALAAQLSIDYDAILQTDFAPANGSRRAAA